MLSWACLRAEDLEDIFMMHRKSFFREFLRHAKQTASVVPTSRSATRKVCDCVDFSRPVVVVEFGPGVGNVAGEIAQRMSPTSRLILIEINPVFVELLRERFAHDERVEVVEGLAQDAERIMQERGIEGADAVLANIPFTFFDDATRRSILFAAKNILKPRGRFIAFPFTTTIRPLLGEVFSSVVEGVIWQNLPPLRVFVATKEG